MLRLMGAALVTGGGLWLGLGRSRQLARRVRALEAWARALALLEGEMAFRLPDLPQLLRALERRCESPVRETLAAAERGMDKLGEAAFWEIWTGAVEQNRDALTPEDAGEVCRLGQVLGRYGWQEQETAVEQLRRGLLERAAAARYSRDREGRAYATAGLALGALVTIMLL